MATRGFVPHTCFLDCSIKPFFTYNNTGNSVRKSQQLMKSELIQLDPPKNPMMKVLDTSKFQTSLDHPAIITSPINCSKAMAFAKKNSLFSKLQKKPKLIFPYDSDKSKMCVLIPEVIVDSVLLNAFLSETNSTIEKVPINLNYENWSASQIIRSILPDEIDDTDVVSGFEIVGHIAHLNLKKFHLPYSSIIGQVILDKNPCIESVVNKLDKIHSKYRFFEMEVIAGKHEYITTTIENKISFHMDFSKVYWNSRLGTEHLRIVNLIETQSTILDMFCGIGPFALPLAKKGCKVHANDLNPDSFHYLEVNVKANKIPPTKITCYNLDGRDFVRSFRDSFDYVLMNLPASASEFLDVFIGLKEHNPALLKSPTVFCYHFTGVDNPEVSSIEAVEKVLEHPIPDATVHLVRKTAPKTWMTCVHFEVPQAVLDGDMKAAWATRNLLPFWGVPRRDMKIYTKTGDKGRTSTYSGKRLPKDDAIFHALGNVDALSSYIGLTRVHCGCHDDVLGSVIATPESDNKSIAMPTFSTHWITDLERKIDTMTTQLPPLSNFILPSGSAASAYLHVCRTATRTAERSLIALDPSHGGDIATVVKYVNRLSDYFFTAARFCSHRDGVPEEIYTKPELE